MSMEMRTIPAYLLYISDDGARQRFDLVKPIYTLGRRESNDIVLQCSQISKDHASIEATETGYVYVCHNSHTHHS